MPFADRRLSADLRSGDTGYRGRLRGCTWALGASGDMRCDTGIAIGAVGSNGAAGGTAPPEMAMRAGVTSWFRAGRKG